MTRAKVVYWSPAAVMFCYLTVRAFADSSLLTRTLGAAFLALMFQAIGAAAFWFIARAVNDIAGKRETRLLPSTTIDMTPAALLLAVAVWIFGQETTRNAIERVSHCVDQASREMTDGGSLPERIVWSCYREPEPGGFE